MIGRIGNVSNTKYENTNKEYFIFNLIKGQQKNIDKNVNNNLLITCQVDFIVIFYSTSYLQKNKVREVKNNIEQNNYRNESSCSSFLAIVFLKLIN